MYYGNNLISYVEPRARFSFGFPRKVDFEVHYVLEKYHLCEKIAFKRDSTYVARHTHA